MFEARNISTGYGAKQIVYDVSLNLRQGDAVLLAGSNGSGKSTLLRALFGLLPLRGTGTISLNGQPIHGLPASTLLKLGLLYLPQKNQLFEGLSVKQNLEIAGLALGKARKGRMEETLDLFPELRGCLKHTAGKLSGGERQLLALAMAMLHKPSLLMLDEPFTGLSPRHLSDIAARLQELNKVQNVTMLIVEHRVRECLALCNRIVGLKQGRIVYESVNSQDFQIESLHPIFV